MSIFNSSNTNSATLFPKKNKAIVVQNGMFVGVNGSCQETSISLSDISIPYNNYHRVKTIVPAGAINFALTFPLVGVKPIFMVIKPKYCGCNSALQYLYWKFIHSNDANNTMTDIMVLTGTNTNPISQILITNPDQTKDVELEILIVSSANDIYTDSEQYYFIQNLSYSSIRSINTNTIGIYDSDMTLILSVDIADINNLFKPQQKRIVIDESTQYDVILEFINDTDANNVLSELTYLLNNPGTVLPMPVDTTAPVITYTPLVDITDPLNKLLTLTLTGYTSSIITKNIIIAESINNVTDDRDGTILVIPANVKIFDNNNIELNNIIMTGTYIVKFTVKDLANNITNDQITLTVN